MTKVKDSLKRLDQDAYLVVGIKNDKLGRFDKKITCIERRPVGGDENDFYYVLCTEDFETDGCLKFGK